MSTPARLPKWFDPRLHGGESRIRGLGLFVREPVRAGELLMRWGGVLIALDDYDPAVYRSSSTSLYDETRYLTTPAGEPRTLDELLNHSCDPNMWLLDEVTVAARRDLAAGEEVTTDYAMWANSAYVFTPECGCGSPLCRHRVTGLDWQNEALQARYRGHFLPFLNRLLRARA